MTVGAPGRYLARYCPIRRAEKSVVPPVVVPTTIVTVLPCSDSASAAWAEAAADRRASAARSATGEHGTWLGRFMRNLPKRSAKRRSVGLSAKFHVGEAGEAEPLRHARQHGELVERVVH